MIGAPPVVVLEDEPAIAALIRHTLAAAGVRNPVETFVDGAAAWTAIEGSITGGLLPVLILLDIHVPELSGLEVLRRIRATDALAGVVVVMLSGSGSAHEIERAYAAGADQYLVKPAGIHGLRDLLSELGLGLVLVPPER